MRKLWKAQEWYWLFEAVLYNENMCWCSVATEGPPLCDLVAHRAPRSMGFSRQEYWSGLPFSPSGTFPTQGPTQGLGLHLLHWQAGSSPLTHLGRPQRDSTGHLTLGLLGRHLLWSSIVFIFLKFFLPCPRPLIPYLYLTYTAFTSLELFFNVFMVIAVLGLRWFECGINKAKIAFLYAYGPNHSTVCYPDTLLQNRTINAYHIYTEQETVNGLFHIQPTHIRCWQV